MKKRRSHTRSRSEKKSARRARESGQGFKGQRDLLYRGRVQKNPRGFAFILPERSGLPDAYVSRQDAGRLMNGDLVEYRMLRQGRRMAAEVGRVLHRLQKQVVGTVRPSGRDLAVLTAEGDLHTIRTSKTRPSPGDWIIASIDKYPTENQRGVVSVQETFGKQLLPKHDAGIAIARFGLSTEFSPEAYKEALLGRKKAFEIFRNPADRRDLREFPFVTIDGEDAKDFDDAVLVQKSPEGRGYILYVAIADVAAYVRPGGALDRDARERGTSVYFPGSVIPMLPEELSNDLCSLRPQTEKLALTAEICFDDSGEIQKSQFYECMIRTARRLTYTEVQAYIDGDASVRHSLAALRVPLDTAAELFHKMDKKRKSRGVLDFDLPECQVIVDKNGRPTECRRAPKNQSNRWIEEFMIAANREVARALRRAGIPALHRIHEAPDRDSINDIQQLLRRLGITKTLTDVTPRGYSQLLESTKGVKGAATLHQAILRLQKQARYSPDPAGHFGLALRDYAHFTSPIRRYPDLVVHRALKQLIHGRKLSDTETEGLFEDLGVITSERERRAMEAERWITKRKQCWFMSERLGEEYRGTVSAVVESGIFVSIESLAIDGFLPLEYMNGFYEFDERRLGIVRRPGSALLSIGDAIQISVASVSVDDNQITFSHVE